MKIQDPATAHCQHGGPTSYGALEMWLVQTEMCCKYKIRTRF